MKTWEDLVEAYLSRFFLHALTSEGRGEIIVFKQKENESLYNDWERNKQLLRRCPMNGIEHVASIAAPPVLLLLQYNQLLM